MNTRISTAVWIAGLALALVFAIALLPEPEPDPATDAARSAASGTADSKQNALRAALVNVRVFDGQNVLDEATVLIDEGRVQAVGAGIDVPANTTVIDGRGKTLIPGLIDSHVHALGPARAQALRFGVTTILDMFSPPMDSDRIRAERERLASTGRADLFSAGYLATVAGGHGTQYGVEVPTLSGPATADEWVAARLAEGSDWIKIVIEDGTAWGGSLPTLSRDTVAALVEAAHRRDRLAVAHVSTYADAMMAIDAGIDGLAHLFADRRVDAEFIAAAKQSGVFVVPTATVLASAYGGPGADWLLDHETLGKRLAPMQRQSLAQSFPGSEQRSDMWAIVEHNIRALNEAGVPLLAGSDAPNPGTAQGISIHAELSLLVAAGLQPIQALRSATSIPARHFGLEARGCIQAGCRADLVLVDGNPLETIEATARIEKIWKNGHPAPVAEERGSTRIAPDEQSAAIDLLDQPERWMAAADDYMGGNSSAAIEWIKSGGSPALAVTIRVEKGFAFPYAGAMWNTTAIPMQPKDHSGHSRLVLEIDGPAGLDYQAMLFSGEAQGGQPVRVPLPSGQESVIDLYALAALDLPSLRAIGVFTTKTSGEQQFVIKRARLE